MKTRGYIGVVFSLLLFAVFLLLFTDPWGLLQRERRDFLIRDPSLIDGILLAGFSDSMSLTRKGDVWLISNEFEANRVAVENLLFAAERLQIDAIHTEPSLWNRRTVRTLSFMQGEKQVLKYEFWNEDGLFMLRVPDSETAYSVSLPGYADLDLNRVFSTKKNHYLEHILIDLLPSEIRFIEVEKRDFPPFRFSLDDRGEITCELPDQDSLVPIQTFEELSIRLLFSYFTSIRYEEKLGKIPLNEEELGERWKASLHVESRSGEKHILQVYSLPGEQGEDDHLFKALVIHDKQSEALIINYIYLDVLMRDLSHYFGDNL